MGPGELQQWQRRLRFTDRRAAAAVGLSVSGWRKQRTGAAPVSRQTELLCGYVQLHDPCWLDIAETATRLARKATTGR